MATNDKPGVPWADPLSPLPPVEAFPPIEVSQRSIDEANAPLTSDVLESEASAAALSQKSPMAPMETLEVLPKDDPMASPETIDSEPGIAIADLPPADRNRMMSEYAQWLRNKKELDVTDHTSPEEPGIDMIEAGTPKDLLKASVDGIFSPVKWATDNPDRMADPATKKKIADTMTLEKERGWHISDIDLWGAAVGVAKLPFELAHWGGRVFQHAVVNPIGGLVSPKLTPTAQYQFELQRDKEAAELLSASETSLTSVADLAIKTAEWFMPTLEKKPSEWTDKQKEDFMWRKIGEHAHKENTLRGHGVYTEAIFGQMIDDAAREGITIDPEEVTQLAAGDPVAFAAFGELFKVGTIGVKAGVRGARRAVGGQLKAIATVQTKAQAIALAEKLRVAQANLAKAGADHAAAIESAGKVFDQDVAAAKARSGAVSAIPGELSITEPIQAWEAGGATQAAVTGAEAAGKSAEAAAVREELAQSQVARSSVGAKNPIIMPAAGLLNRVYAAEASIAKLKRMYGQDAVTGAERAVDIGLATAATGVAAAARVGQFGTWLARGVLPGIVKNRALTAAPGAFKTIAQKASGVAGGIIADRPDLMSPMLRLFSDMGKAVGVDVAKKMGEGLALDLSLSAMANETPEETRNTVFFATGLGALGGIRLGSGRIVQGQLARERAYGPDRPLSRSGNYPDLDAATELSLKLSEKSPGIQRRLNALRQALAPLGNEIFLATTPEAFENAIRKHAPDWSEQRIQEAIIQQGVTLENNRTGSDGKPRALSILRELQPAEHEAVHSMLDIFSAEGRTKLANLARTHYANEWESIGENYTRRAVDPQMMAEYRARGEGWRDALLDFTQADPNWRSLSEPEARAKADRYIAEEILADVGGNIIKNRGPDMLKAPGFPGKLARVLAETMKGFGAEPFRGAETAVLDIPQKFRAQEEIRRGLLGELENAADARATAAYRAKIAVAPKGGGAAPGGAVPPVTPKGSPPAAPPAPTTPEEAGRRAGIIADAQPATPLPRGTRPAQEVARDIVQAISIAGPIQIDYAHAKGDVAAAIISGRRVRRAEIEAGRGKPLSERELGEMLFYPEQMVAIGGGKVQIVGWAPDVFAANAVKLAKAVNDAGGSLRLPYPVDPKTGSFTPDGWRILFDDAKQFAENQRSGATGSGQPLVVPKSMLDQGFTQPAKLGEPGREINQDRADVISALFGIEVQKSNTATGRVYPRNLAGQAVSEATMPGRVKDFVQPRVFEGKAAEKAGVAGQPIREVNPFRTWLEEAGIKPDFIEVIQRLNLDRVADVTTAPILTPPIRAVEFTTSAGFAPKSEEGKGGHAVDIWFDKRTKNWVSQVKDKNGDQIGDAAYVATKREALADAFIGKDDAFWGISENEKLGGAAFDRSGRSAVECTGYACEIQAKLGKQRVKVFGFYEESNPASKIAQHYGGHDFAVVDGQYIVDPWVVDIANMSRKGVFDLKQDATEIKDLYGERNSWEKLPEQKPSAFAPKSATEWAARKPTDLLDDIHKSGISLTGSARDLGRAMKPEDVAVLEAAADKASAEATAATDAGDFDTAMPAAMTAQFFHEAIQQHQKSASGAPQPDWRVSVQTPSGEMPGNVQIIDPRQTEGSQSPTVESLRAAGHTVPEFSQLPQGSYTYVEATAKLEKPTSQFAPATDAGRALEARGFKIEREWEGARFGFNTIQVKNKEGQVIGNIASTIDANDFTSAKIDGVYVDEKYRKQGIAEVLYREALTALQADGVKSIRGYVVNPTPIKLREKLLGVGNTTYSFQGEPLTMADALDRVRMESLERDSGVGGPKAISVIPGDAKFAPKPGPDTTAAAIPAEETDLPRVPFVRRKDEAERRLVVPQKPEDRALLVPQKPEDRGSQFAPQPNEDARKVAKDYVENTLGIPYTIPPKAPQVDETIGRQIAEWYDAAKHDPNAPEVANTYSAFVKETKDQWDAIKAAGYVIEPWKGKGEPYKSSDEMTADVRDNKHLYFLPTEGNFEGNADHPLLAPSGVPGLKANDLFRVVHDFKAHVVDGNMFGPIGELNAWKAHSQMYSEAAQAALAAETLGQNSWVNFGKHMEDEIGKIPKRGEPGYVALPNRPYAEQKAIAMPQELIDAANTQFAPQKPEDRILSGERLVAETLTKKQADALGYDTGEMKDFPIKRITAPGGYLDFEEGPNGIWIQALNIDPARRRQGRATDLLTQLQRYAGEKTIFPGGFSEEGVVLKPTLDRLGIDYSTTPKSDAQSAPPPNSVRKKFIEVEHKSSMLGLTKIDPKYFGKGKATNIDRRGMNKSFFFVKGSKLGGDDVLFGKRANLRTYSGQIPGEDLYDLRAGKSDPLEWRSTINAEKADQNVIDAGFKGILLDTHDGRQVVAMFKPTPVVARYAPQKPGDRDALPGFESGRPKLSAQQLAGMSKQEVREHFPEAVVPRANDEAIPSNIVGSPLYKQSKDEPAAVKAFADRLVEFAREYEDLPEYQLGAKWYSDFIPQLKKEFGADADIMAELLAATSPQANPTVNFGYALDALLSLKSGRFRKLIPKYEEGLAKIDDGSWEKWLSRNVQGGANTPAAFLANWVGKYDLQPRQSNGALYGKNSRSVLQVLARRWMKDNAGPKTRNFVENLLGKSDEATVDIWADRTMRWAGYEGHQQRWRIMPENVHGVSEADFKFSQQVFRDAAEQLGMKPSALQGALWFAEKKRWSDNGWGRLDLGSFQKEMANLPLLKAGFEQRVKTAGLQKKIKPMEQQGLDIEPRFK